MKFTQILKQVYKNLRNWRDESLRQNLLNTYIKNGRKPWSAGYFLFKEKFIKQVINDASLLKKFRENQTLPEKYGEFLDERVVEYPWFLSRCMPEGSRLLDVGSSLNFDYILQHAFLKQKEIAIITLEPEMNCSWKEGISYLFGDSRELPFQNNFFDEVVSISTIEHIGMDNSMYSNNKIYKERKSWDFLQAVSEFKRVTKPGGKVYITVPYGSYTDFGWYQQFNADMIQKLIAVFEPKKLIETYYCYQSGGWLVSDRQSCQNFEGFNIHDTKYFNPNSLKDYDSDFAACSRAIAALELWK